MLEPVRYYSEKLMATEDNTQRQEAFIPRRGLSNSHLQTLAGNFLPRTSLLPPAEERLFQVEEGVQVLCHCHWQPEVNRQSALTLVIVHGLEGSTDSKYVIGTGSKAWLKGMNVVRMNMRNCGDTERLTPTLYHSGMSNDVGAVVRSLIDDDKLQHIALVGFSMGGNIVLKMAGEWGSNAPKQLVGVAGVSPAMDLAPSADALHDPPNRIYEWRFLNKLSRRFQRKVKLFPDIYDARYARRYRTIREFDHEVTARYNGFTSADDYYERASASRVAAQIAVPTLVVHSTDDPFIRMMPETREVLLANPHVEFLETRHGGHCAFLAAANGYDGRWAEKSVVDFLQKQIAKR